MKRSEFLKSFGLGTAGLVLPSHLLDHTVIEIYDNYVRGLQFYEYKKQQSNIKEGDELQMIRDSENAYDNFAIKVHWQNQMLGYIAAYENIVLANMLDQKAELQAFVSTKSTQYFELSISVFAKLIIPKQNLTSTNNNQRADDATDLYRNNINHNIK